MSDKKIRVLIVDDADFMRRALTRILEADPDIEVVGYGKTGREGIDAIRELRPDVVTLDIDMPEMDGITALKHIMIKYPTPVVVVSALTHQGQITFESLRLGVVDFLPKPSGSVSRDMELQKEDLIRKIKIASAVDIEKVRRARIRAFEKKGKRGAWSKKGILVIGTSLGGPNNLIRFISKLPEDFPLPIVVTQDISPVILESFVEKFDSVSPIRIRKAEDGVWLDASTAYISSLDKAVTFERNRSGDVVLRVNSSEGNSIDKMMVSAAEVMRSGTIGFLFAGAEDDGVKGLMKINDMGGETLMENGNSYIFPESQMGALKGANAKSVQISEDTVSLIIELIGKIERGERE
ncbi:MAG: response regulator [Deltaproteobacteria bacterium]|uniref:protein-glutamate methylesterase n=1 Tax=Candidatus Zymogenus saltonus TaxID=2844893 RepID=A0A9D8PJZ9_9DELT|nr:response regulator [Candidatus Zymogenus saltonus]